MSVTRVLALLALLACGKTNPYVCAGSEQCVSHGMAGVCSDGSCAFADSACASGLRYEPNAGGGLGGTCTAAPADASTACGAFGQSCCSTGVACSPGGVCKSGTCSSCVVDVALGRRFACWLKDDHTVWCSGDNMNGQLGFGVAGVGSATAIQVKDTTSAAITDATAIGAGRDHACAVRTSGTVWCWGLNAVGQIGNGAGSAGTLAPAAVQVVMTNNMPLTGIVDVRAGDGHTCARDGTGGLWCWGQNADGELGDGTTTAHNKAAAVLVAPAGASFVGATDLMIGASHNCTHKVGDELWCWGQNNGALLDTTGTSKPNPIKIGTAAQVATGRFHSCQINADTSISCGGWNGHARLGIGTGTGYSDGNHTTPVTVLASPGGSPFVGAMRLAAGGESCALMQDSSVQCWGDDAYGQTGTGVSETVPAPVVHANGTPLTGVARLLAHYAHVCAQTIAGEYLCWGRNNYGELGDGTFTNHGFPSPLGASCP